jgi:predicted TIM-barrel fold metal-dependent hydrolase
MSSHLSPRNPHIPVRLDWLELTQEEVIDPELPIIDAHHHLWIQHGEPYLLNEYCADLSGGHNVRASVAVECKAMFKKNAAPHLAPLGELEFLNGIAAMSASGNFGECLVAHGIVARVDLTHHHTVSSVLDLYQHCAPERFKGIRISSIWHPDPSASASLANPPQGLLMSSDFRLGFKELGPRGLTFDAWVYHTQIDEVIDLAKTFTNTVIVVDHIAGPNGIGPFAGKRKEVFEIWNQSIKKLAFCDNVRIKLGGMGMKVFGFDFHEKNKAPSSDELSAQWSPYIHSCIETFGANRCMFESNFPVDKGSYSYSVMWNAFKKTVANYSIDEKYSLFFNTANKTYRLGLETQIA